MGFRVNTSCLQDLVNPDKGFFLIKRFLTSEQVDAYRTECESLIHTVPRLTKVPGYGEEKVNRDDMFDFVFASLNKMGEVAHWRLYQYLYNRHSPETQEIYEKAILLRNHIEGHWDNDLEYKKTKESLRDYIHVMKHVADGSSLKKHSDFKGRLSYPILQCVVLLSCPQYDFKGGELVVYTKSGRRVQIHSELKMNKGDALFFDKSLFHEVEPTYRVASNAVGRWSVIIGARYGAPTTALGKWAIIIGARCGLPKRLPALFRRVIRKSIQKFEKIKRRSTQKFINRLGKIRKLLWR